MPNQTSTIAPWRPYLAKALHQNRSLAYARYLQLATIAPNGTPRNRTVVFRGFQEPTDRLQIITDTRSEKIDQIRANPRAEACWYFPKTRVQFRIAGRIVIVTADTPDAKLQAARRNLWHNISDSARSSFAWPQPGADRAEPAAFEVEPLDPKLPLESFALLLLEPDRVDFLNLRGEPQDRTIFTRSDIGWETQEVNP